MPLSHTWINSTDAALDEKLGLFAVKLPFTVSPGLTKMATLKHALTFLPDEVANFGIPLVKRDVKERPDCGYDVIFSLDGHFTPEAATGEDFRLEGTTSDDPIESHPNIAMLVDRYYRHGARVEDAADESGTIHWPAKLQTAAGGSVPNPMFGVKTYLVPGMVWTHSFVSPNFPEGLASQLGCIGEPPVGRLGQKPPRSYISRDWFMARLAADWRGNIWKIQESWVAAGANGATPDIYRRYH